MSSKKEKRLDIRFNSDGYLLHGTLHLPGTLCPAVVVGCHGLYANQNSPKQLALARACNARGLAYFRFDHRGCGRSQGEFEKVTSLGARRRDLKNVITMLGHRSETGKAIGLFGSSMGGTVCLSIAPHFKIKAIVTFAAPLCSHMMDRNAGQSHRTPAPKIFLDARKTPFDIAADLASVHNLLVIHGERDQTVPLAHAREIHRLAADPKRLIIQPGGDHRMSNADHQNQFVREAGRWFASSLRRNKSLTPIPTL